MCSSSTKFRFILGLSLIVVFLPLRNCTPIETNQHDDDDDYLMVTPLKTEPTPLRDDYGDWLRWTLPKPQPKPLRDDDEDWLYWTLPEPKPTPLRDVDDFWFRWIVTTWKPFTFRPTLRPIIIIYHEKKSSGFNWALLFKIGIPAIVVLLCCIFLSCRSNFCKSKRKYTAAPTAAPPPKSPLIPPRSTTTGTTYNFASLLDHEGDGKVLETKSSAIPLNEVPLTKLTKSPPLSSYSFHKVPRAKKISMGYLDYSPTYTSCHVSDCFDD